MHCTDVHGAIGKTQKHYIGAFVHVRSVIAINTRRTINPALSGTNRSVLIGTPAMVCDRPTTSRIIPPPSAKPKAHHGQQITDTYHDRKRAHQLQRPSSCTWRHQADRHPTEPVRTRQYRCIAQVCRGRSAKRKSTCRCVCSRTRCNRKQYPLHHQPSIVRHKPWCSNSHSRHGV